MIVRLVLNIVKRNDTIVLEEMSIYGIFSNFSIIYKFYHNSNTLQSLIYLELVKYDKSSSLKL